MDLNEVRVIVIIVCSFTRYCQYYIVKVSKGIAHLQVVLCFISPLPHISGPDWTLYHLQFMPDTLQHKPIILTANKVFLCHRLVFVYIFQ